MILDLILGHQRIYEASLFFTSNCYIQGKIIMSIGITLGEDINFNLLYIHSIYFHKNKTPQTEKKWWQEKGEEKMKCSLSTHGLYLKARRRALKIEVDKKGGMVM